MISQRLLLMLSLLVLVACAPEPLPKAETPLRPVRYVIAQKDDAFTNRSFTGTSQAGLESKLSFKVAGTIAKVHVKLGDQLYKKQLIAELDPTDYRLRMQEADASLARARAEARNADANYQRVRLLYEHNTAPRTELDSARAASESARAAVLATLKQVQLAKLQLSYTQMKAPVACAVASVDVKENENVVAGQIVVRVACGDQPEVEVGVPEVLIARVEPGAIVTVSFDALPDKRFAAVVAEVGVSTSGQGAMFPVTVRLQESDAAIRPGMAAEVLFRFRPIRDQRMRLPSVAVGEDRDGRFVFVVEPQDDATGIARRRSVTTGSLTVDGLEILDGVSEGEYIVTAGVSRIEDGFRVRLLPNESGLTP